MGDHREEVDKTLFLHKKQSKVLDSKVKALTKKKEEKENVLTYLELINLNNVILLQSKGLKRKTIKVERKQLMEDNKEYKKKLQHLQTQLKRAREQNKNLDPTGIKKRLEDYEQMKMKNKMKDFEEKFEEWWEVAKEYFAKELEKNLAQHRADERIIRYMLEAYQKNFPDFICGNPTSTKVLGQDEETKVGPSGIAQEEEVQTEESQDLRS